MSLSLLKKRAMRKGGAKVKVGDKVTVTTDTECFEGTLLECYDPTLFLIKLRSGYNVAVEKKRVKKIEKVGVSKAVRFPSIRFTAERKKPGIAVIVTGGTIAGRVDYTTGGVKWLIKPEELFFLAPKLFDIVKINKIEVPFTLASENLSATHWQTLAKIVAGLLNKKENKGVVITHGTDTLHYTAAALAFMLKDLSKPVVLTYAQRSSDRGSTDTVLNLTCSGYAALSDIAEVSVVGHETPHDRTCLMLRGTKCRKLHTSRRDTFRPVNDLPLAKVSEAGKIEVLNRNYSLRDESRKVTADTAFEEKVALVKFFPGARPALIGSLVEQGYKGIVIEATGLGHVATDEAGRLSWLPALKKAIEKGVTICFAPQTLYGRLNPYVYTPARKLLEVGVLYLADMLPETAYVKLGYVLGHERKPEKIKKAMLTNMAGEFNESISENSFLY